MKKRIIPLFVLCLALLCVPFTAMAADETVDYRLGDANNDGKLNTADITTIRRYISDGRTTDPNGYNVTIHPNAADVDGNGRINTMDITLIRRYIADNWKTDPNGYNVTLKPGKMDCTHNNMTAFPEKAPTCTEPGNIAYWYCQPCDKYYADAEAKYEILLESTVLEAGHDFDTLWATDRDSHWHDPLCEHVDELADLADHNFVNQHCSVCGTEQTFSVTFMDNAGSVLSQQYVSYNGSAIAPADLPERAGYVLTGWDGSFVNVTEDVTVTAIYEQVFTVTFQDYDGYLLKTETVVSGHAATAPSIDNLPVPEGFKRIGWDTEFDNVIGDLTVTVAYEKLTYTVTFCNPDGSVIDTFVTEHGADAQAPACDEYYFDWSTYQMGAFSGWSQSLKNIKKDTTIYAEYLDPYQQPVISIDTTGSTASIKLYAPAGCYIYAMDFGFGWEGEISISNCTKNNASSLYKGNNCSYNFDYNNKYNNFRYTWTNAEGVAIGGNYATVATITFETDGGTSVSKDVLELLSNSMLVYSFQQKASMDQLQTITPIIVVK